MTDLVTGAAGFIGSHLATTLRERGNEVRALVLSTSKYERLQNKGIKIYIGDITKPQTLIEPLRGVDRIFHCAARVSDWGAKDYFYNVNVRGTENMLNACKHSPLCRFIHISSTVVYGHPDKVVDETAPFKYRRMPYCDSKIEAEKKVWQHMAKHKLAGTIIRAGNVYGIDSFTFVSDIIDLLKKGKMVHLGRKLKPAGLCHVDNLVSAIILAAENKASIGQAYNVTDGSDISWRTFVNMLADISQSAPPKHVIPRDLAYFLGWCMEQVFTLRKIAYRPLLTRMAVSLFTTNQGFSIEKAKKELGYDPVKTFEQGMEEIKAVFGKVG